MLSLTAMTSATGSSSSATTAAKPGDKAFWNIEVAYKYKMSSLQAALGLAQLELLERKRHIFACYQERLAGLAGVTLNAEPEGTRNSYWMVTVILDPAFGITKDRLMEALSERGIDCRPFFHPLSSLPAYAGVPEADQARQRNSVSYRLAPYGINLPSALALTEQQVDTVCDSLKRLVR